MLRPPCSLIFTPPPVREVFYFLKYRIFQFIFVNNNYGLIEKSSRKDPKMVVDAYFSVLLELRIFQFKSSRCLNKNGKRNKNTAILF